MPARQPPHPEAIRRVALTAVERLVGGAGIGARAAPEDRLVGEWLAEDHWEGEGTVGGDPARFVWRIRAGGPSPLIVALSGNGHLEPQPARSVVLFRLAESFRASARRAGLAIEPYRSGSIAEDQCG